MRVTVDTNVLSRAVVLDASERLCFRLGRLFPAAPRPDPGERRRVTSVPTVTFCMALAKAMGLPTAKADMIAVADRRVLLVTRYERFEGDDGKPVRIHQEDFCQALGVVPEMKYQNEGGPNLKACFDLLRKVTRPHAPEVLRLLDAVVFNALIGNHDAHAKNFSLLYAGSTLTMAPLYDLLSTAVYENLTLNMAMKLGSKYKFTQVEARHWEQFAEAAGLSKAQTKRRVLRIAKDLPSVARQLKASPPFQGQPMSAQIVALIEQRSALTMRRLLEGGN